MLNNFKTWHSGLSGTSKVVAWSIAAVVALSAANMVSASSDPAQETPPKGDNVVAQNVPPEPEVEKKTVNETETIPFDKKTIEDSNLEKGKTTLRTSGSNGTRTLTYEITYTDGKETSKTLIKNEITKEPVNEVVAIGTYVALPPKPRQPRSPGGDGCDPNYSGCVPVASDVDCAGGSGNGPAYARGPVSVIGSDIYDLDRDGDGVACE
jgi:hypothetical protein